MGGGKSSRNIRNGTDTRICEYLDMKSKNRSQKILFGHKKTEIQAPTWPAFLRRKNGWRLPECAVSGHGASARNPTLICCADAICLLWMDPWAKKSVIAHYGQTPSMSAGVRLRFCQAKMLTYCGAM